MKKKLGETVKAAGILLLAKEKNQTSFLLMRHRDRWDLPKGHCEANETFEQTALRETEEETGIAADSITLDPDFVFDLHYPVTYARHGDHIFDKHVRYFIGRISGRPALKLTEHESAQWFPWDPSPKPIQPHTIDPLLAAIARHLSSSVPRD